MRHPSTIERDYASSAPSVPPAGAGIAYSMETIAAAYDALQLARLAAVASDAGKLEALEAYYSQLTTLLARVVSDTGLGDETP